MDSELINWDALDALIIEFESEKVLEDKFAKSENLIEYSLPSSPPSTCRSRQIIHQIRRSLEAGDIENVVKFLSSHAPSILDNRRLLFTLQKQRFVELLRKGLDSSPIHFLRTVLAPCVYPILFELLTPIPAPSILFNF